MRVLFDTSVLVAGFLVSHPKHHSALTWLQQVKKKKISLFVSGHSLAECFSVLTRLPLSPRISPDTAHYLLRENVEKFAKIITLSPRDYLMIIKHMTELGLTGGIIYDGLLVRAAKKAKVNKILTFNQRDFIRLCPDNPSFICSP